AGEVEVATSSNCVLDQTSIRLNASVYPGLGAGGQGGIASFACNDIEVKGASLIEANGFFGPIVGNGGGGPITLYCGAGACTLEAKSKLRARSKFDVGGVINVTADGSCSLAGQIDGGATPEISAFDGEISVGGGDGGLITVDCGSIAIPARGKVTAGT